MSKTMSGKRWIALSALAIAILVSLSACTGTPVVTPDGGPSGMTLKFLGNSLERTAPGAASSIIVLLCEEKQEACQVVPGKEIRFALSGNYGGTRLDVETALTDEAGTAKAGLIIGSDVNGTFRVGVSAPAFNDVQPIYKTYSVQSAIKSIEFPDGDTREIRVRSNIMLAAKLVATDYAQSGGDSRSQPVPGEDLTFRLVKGDKESPSCYFGTPGTYEVISRTNAQGLAMVGFYTGLDTKSYYVKVSGGGADEREMALVVSTTPPCTNSKECGQGMICRDGTCVKDGDIPCSKDNPCPEGMTCNPATSICEPNFECPPGFELKAPCPGCAPECVLKDIECNNSHDCPAGYICKDHKCVPCSIDADCAEFGPDYKCIEGTCRRTNCPEFDGIKVSGLWYTQHSFDLSNALIGFPKLAGPLDLVDQAINKGDLSRVCGKIPIICPILGKIVKSAVDQYLPPWVGDLVAGLNSLANIFQVMNVEGEMQLWQNGGPVDTFTGRENWQSVMLYFVQNCPKGRQDPNWPQCAEMDIMLGDTNINVKEVRNFAGRIDCNLMTIYDREVQMEVYKLLEYVINMVVKITTGYDTLEEASKYLIDCPALAANLEKTLCGSCGIEPLLEIFCEAIKTEFPAALMQWLNQQGTDWTAFKFHGSAEIVDPELDKYADKLIKGQWKGTVSVIMNGDMTGTWNAER